MPYAGQRRRTRSSKTPPTAEALKAAPRKTSEHKRTRPPNPSVQLGCARKAGIPRHAKWSQEAWLSPADGTSRRRPAHRDRTRESGLAAAWLSKASYSAGLSHVAHCAPRKRPKQPHPPGSIARGHSASNSTVKPKMPSTQGESTIDGLKPARTEISATTAAPKDACASAFSRTRTKSKHLERSATRPTST
jgi:hypothetical protein